MANGTLKITTSMGQDALAVANAGYAIMDANGQVLASGVTNENGESQIHTLTAPPRDQTLTPNPNIRPYGTYNVWVRKPGFVPQEYRNVQIFDGMQSILNVNMIPLTEGTGNQPIIIDTPPPTAALPSYDNSEQQAPPDEPIGRAVGISPQVLNQVRIPEFITVLLGHPSAAATARRVRIRFSDYIKNVTSSEIYPTWPVNSILANVHAIVSFTLNRIYTQWYRSRGFDFDITNSTAVDQAFIYGRNIFQNISQIVDAVFNVYARRIGFRNPYFTSYCNGTTATCRGMSQWGTVPLAQQGLTPLQILHRFYPRDLELVTALGGGVVDAFPGTLSLGTSNANVRRIQDMLNRLRVNFPAIPAIPNPNGTFDAATQNSVRIFQRTFGLTQDGIVGRATWNRIVQIFVAVTNLAELGGEGTRIGLSPTPPTNIVRQGARGNDVVHIQWLLNFVSQFYPEVPSVIQDSVFGSATDAAVRVFQRRFGIGVDGIVGPITWRTLYQVVSRLIGQLPPGTPTPPITSPNPQPPTPPSGGLTSNGTPQIPPGQSVPFVPNWPPYGGTLLRRGSRGDEVRTLQMMLNVARQTFSAIPQLDVDGIFGPITENAVRTYQLFQGLGVDGIVGPITWGALRTMQQWA